MAPYPAPVVIVANWRRHLGVMHAGSVFLCKSGGFHTGLALWGGGRGRGGRYIHTARSGAAGGWGGGVGWAETVTEAETDCDCDWALQRDGSGGRGIEEVRSRHEGQHETIGPQKCLYGSDASECDV